MEIRMVSQKNFQLNYETQATLNEKPIDFKQNTCLKLAENTKLYQTNLGHVIYKFFSLVFWSVSSEIFCP